MDAITLGARLIYDDNDCTVEAIGAGQVFLRADTGVAYSLTPAAALLAHRASTLAPEQESSTLDLTTLLEGLPDEIIEDAHWKLAHVREVLTGHSEGNAVGDPKPMYNPLLSPKLGDRQAAKAAELEISLATVQRWCRSYKNSGIAGLVDKRKSGLTFPLRGVDPRIIEAIEAVADGETNASTGSRQRFNRRVRRYLDENHGVGKDDLPTDRTLSRYADYITSGRYTFDKATTRRSRAVLGPKVFRGFQATRAGEAVLLDANRLDILAWDPATDTAIAVELLTALDAYTRAILAWRFMPLSTGATDVSMLIADVLNPVEMREHWEETLRFAALQIPYSRLVEIDERLAHAAARPIVYPENLLVDNAKVFISTAVRKAMESIGIGIDLARIRQGTDKGAIERSFSTMRTQFAQHSVGYKGNTVVNRGDHIEDQALWTIAELDELFAEWAVVVHNRRVNRTLFLGLSPDLNLSPLEAYHESIARCGLIPVPPNQHLYIDLLPTKWVTIQQGYIDVKGLSYSGDAVINRDHEPSPYTAKKCKWPVKYDPRDRLYVYFQDRDGTWSTLRWIHAWDGIQPFSERMIDTARRLRNDRESRRMTQVEVGTALHQLQNFIDIPPEQAIRVRRRRSRDIERGRQVDIDRQNSGSQPVPPLRVVQAGDAGLVEPDEDFDLDDLEDLPLFEGPT